MKALYLRKDMALAPLAKRVWLAVCELPRNQDWKISITKAESQRSLDQNAKMWAMLRDFSNQVQWVINGRWEKLSAEDWKDVLTAAMQEETRVAEWGDKKIMLGLRTSKMSVRKMGELIEFMHSVGADYDVKFTDASRWAA